MQRPGDAGPFQRFFLAIFFAQGHQAWHFLFCEDDFFAAPAGYLRERYDQASDGMVVPDDAVIPGARWVELDDMDHGESVLAGVRGFVNYEPGDVTQVLVALALAD